MSLVVSPDTPGGKAYMLVGELKKQGRISSVEAEALREPIGAYIRLADEIAKKLTF